MPATYGRTQLPGFFADEAVALYRTLRSRSPANGLFYAESHACAPRAKQGFERNLRVLESFGPGKNVMETPVVVMFARRTAVRGRCCTAPAGERTSVTFGKQRPQWDSLVCSGLPIRGGASILALNLLEAI